MREVFSAETTFGLAEEQSAQSQGAQFLRGGLYNEGQ